VFFEAREKQREESKTSLKKKRHPKRNYPEKAQLAPKKGKEKTPIKAVQEYIHQQLKSHLLTDQRSPPTYQRLFLDTQKTLNLQCES